MNGCDDDVRDMIGFVKLCDSACNGGKARNLGFCEHPEDSSIKLGSMRDWRIADTHTRLQIGSEESGLHRATNACK